MGEPELIKRPEINGHCTGCFYKYNAAFCPIDEGRHLVCMQERIIFQKVKEKKK